MGAPEGTIVSMLVKDYWCSDGTIACFDNASDGVTVTLIAYCKRNL